MAFFKVNKSVGLGTIFLSPQPNLLLKSEQFGYNPPTSPENNVGLWEPTQASVLVNQTTAPNNALSADVIVDTSVNADHHIEQWIVKAASAITYTFSCYVKAKDRTRIALLCSDIVPATPAFCYVGYDISGSQIAYGPVVDVTADPFVSIGQSIEAAANGFVRCIMSFISNTQTTVNCALYMDNGAGLGAQSTTYIGDGTSGIYIWGAQTEQGSSATAYNRRG